LLDSPNPRLWLIALILADTEKVVPIVRKVKSHYASQAGEGTDWLDLLETVLVYKLPKLTREEIQDMLGFNDVELKKTRFYQDVFVEGRQEGREEGRAEGRMEGEAAVLLRLMERKFHPLSESARQRVADADAETLLVWAERVLDATCLEDVWGN